MGYANIGRISDPITIDEGFIVFTYPIDSNLPLYRIWLIHAAPRYPDVNFNGNPELGEVHRDDRQLF